MSICDKYLGRRLTALALVAVAVAAAGGCSSDPDSVIGSEFVDSILGSNPGVVFQDTIEVAGDTVLAYNTLLASSQQLKLGRNIGYARTILLRPDFSNTNGDEGRVVESASLRMRIKELKLGSQDAEEIEVRFYRLAEEYSESDSVETLDTLSAIVDPVSGTATRLLVPLTALNPLPADLVQGWIRGDSANTSIAIVYQGDVDSLLATFDSKESNLSDADPPTIQVTFTDQTSSSYKMSADATFVRPLGTTTNLIVSDGFVRRVWFRPQIDQVSDSSAVHSARIKFYVVPGTPSGIDRVELYVPGSDDPASSAFLSGAVVTDAFFGTGTEEIEFSVTNALLRVLAGSLPDNGFVMKYNLENSDVRFVEFFGSDDPDLAPILILTSSTPADFDP